MAKKSKMTTAAYILLDRSGSMSSLWEEALGSINGYVKGLPVDSRVVLAVFDSLGYDVIRNTIAGDWKNVTGEDAVPRGGTPLFDASARMMQRILDDKSDRAVFVTMTDGEENQSQHFKQTHVKNLVNELEKKDYQVIFLGANFDKVGDVANQYGVNLTRSAWNMQAGTFGQTMTGLAAQSMNYMTTGAAMNAADLDTTKTRTAK
jgi:hypothetical protein